MAINHWSQIAFLSKYISYNDFFLLPELLESSGVSPSLVCKTITQVLRLELTKEEVLPLLHSLIDGLTDEVVTSAKGASLVLCSLLETRGFEEDVAGIILPSSNFVHKKIPCLETFWLHPAAYTLLCSDGSRIQKMWDFEYLICRSNSNGF